MTGPNDEMEIAPLVSAFPGGGVFKGAGNSHFTYDSEGFHVVTEIPGYRESDDVGPFFPKG